MKIISRRVSPFRLEVRRSKIHQRGVFAVEPIPARRMVIEYTGERITQKEAVDRYLRSWKGGKPKASYLFEVSKNRVVDGAVGGDGAEIINHSCRPNLITRIRRGHVYYFSRKTILPGAELTVDYRFSKSAVKVRCHCGSPNCRGTINLK